MLGTKLFLLILPTSRIFACKGTPSSQSDIDGLFFCCCSLIQCLASGQSQSTTKTGLDFGKSPFVASGAKRIRYQTSRKRSFSCRSCVRWLCRTICRKHITDLLLLTAWRLVFADRVRGRACCFLYGCEITRPPISVVCLFRRYHSKFAIT